VRSLLTLILVLLLAAGTLFAVWQGMAILGDEDVRPPARLPDRAPEDVSQGTQPRPAFAGEDPAAAPAGVPWALRNAEGIEAL
jgi:hypothetical protein